MTKMTIWQINRRRSFIFLEKIQNDTDKYFERLILKEEYKNKKRSDFYRIEIDHEKIEGKKISLKDFLGKYYNTKKQKFALRGRSSDFLNSYFWSDKEETAENWRKGK